MGRFITPWCPRLLLSAGRSITYGGWKFLRGNTDFTFSGSYTDVARGPETRYFAFDYGIRRNFIPRNWRVVPYFDARGGVGNINAKGPAGVLYAQGQDLTFTLMMGRERGITSILDTAFRPE